MSMFCLCEIVLVIAFFNFALSSFRTVDKWLDGSFSIGSILLQDDFTSEDFANMPAPLAYQMFKAKTEFPLHAAIRAQREDVVFLYMVEHDSQVSALPFDV